VPEAISISQLRESLREAFTRAVERHHPVLVERHDELAALIGLDDLERLLSGVEFRSEVFLEEGAVTFWLPEFALYGRGATYDEAQEDLADEVRAYVDDYLNDSEVYLRSPNRAGHFPHVVRALVADARGRLLETLFAPPADESQAAAEQRAAAAV
jgi:antitoxin of RelE/RelB toxin-antitoxin system